MEASTILYCKDRLQEQLQKAKESLKGVDNNLKKFISRTASETSNRAPFNKNISQLNERWKLNGRESNFPNNYNRRRPANAPGDDIENIPVKRRLGPKILHSSISGPPRKADDYDDVPTKKPTVSSCVIAKPHVLPPRKEAVSVKTYTETRARDRRMFGALLGTLQKFRQEETQLKVKEDKKAKVEKRLEEAARREKEKIKRDRQKLMDFRKQRESYIRAVENNMKLVKEQELWEELHKPLYNYIQTEVLPVICYLPKVHNEQTSDLLEQCRTKLTILIEGKRESVKQEVESLIAQYQNIDVNEFAIAEPLPLPSPRNKRINHQREEGAEEGTWTIETAPVTSSQDNENIATNGSWSTNGALKSWRTDNSAGLHPGKEQGIKKKITSGISIKKEKVDDYESHQEKEDGEVTDDKTEDNAESKETDDQSFNESVSEDDAATDDKSPENFEHEIDQNEF